MFSMFTNVVLVVRKRVGVGITFDTISILNAFFQRLNPLLLLCPRGNTMNRH